jgi:hypothetical protein
MINSIFLLISFEQFRFSVINVDKLSDSKCNQSTAYSLVELNLMLSPVSSSKKVNKYNTLEHALFGIVCDSGSST